MPDPISAAALQSIGTEIGKSVISTMDKKFETDKSAAQMVFTMAVSFFIVLACLGGYIFTVTLDKVELADSTLELKKKVLPVLNEVYCSTTDINTIRKSVADPYSEDIHEHTRRIFLAIDDLKNELIVPTD